LKDHFEHAKQLWRDHDLDGAIAEVRAQMSAEGFDDRPGGHHCLGILLSEKHLYDEAVAEFEKAVELIPENPFTRYEFGTVLSDKGDLRRAVEQFEQVIVSNRISRQRTKKWACSTIALAIRKPQSSPFGRLRASNRLTPALAAGSAQFWDARATSPRR